MFLSHNTTKMPEINPFFSKDFISGGIYLYKVEFTFSFNQNIQNNIQNILLYRISETEQLFTYGTGMQFPDKEVEFWNS